MPSVRDKVTPGDDLEEMAYLVARVIVGRTDEQPGAEAAALVVMRVDVADDVLPAFTYRMSPELARHTGELLIAASRVVHGGGVARSVHMLPGGDA